MKKTLGSLLMVGTLMTAAPVFAQNFDCSETDLSNLSAQQVANLQELCKAQSIPAKVTEVTPEKVKEWAEIGKDFSTAVTSTAAGLGQTANQFLFTPLGILIAFYFLWGKIGGILVGIPLLVALWVLYCTICNRYSKDSVEYENVPVLWGAWNMKRKKSVRFSDNDDVVAVWVLLAIPTIGISTFILGILVF